MAERKSFLLRIDPALWAELEAWAQDELRSANGQIEYLLKQAVQKRKARCANPRWRGAVRLSRMIRSPEAGRWMRRMQTSAGYEASVRVLSNWQQRVLY